MSPSAVFHYFFVAMAKNSSPLIVLVPYFFAFSSLLEPGFSAITKISVFLVTVDSGIPPRVEIRTLAAERVYPSSVPVIQIRLPVNSGDGKNFFLTGSG